MWAINTDMNIYIITVRHTGTHFGFNFLTNLGKKSGQDYFHAHVSDAYDMDDRYPELLNPDTKTIFTIRDPYLGALRLAGRMDNVQSSQENVNKLAREWTRFLELVPKIDHCLLDIGCRDFHKYNHLCEVAEYIGCDPNNYPDLKKFAEEWKPANENSENKQYKDHYLATGNLPPKIDFSALEPAYEWYANLKTNDK